MGAAPCRCMLGAQGAPPGGADPPSPDELELPHDGRVPEHLLQQLVRLLDEHRPHLLDAGGHVRMRLCRLQLPAHAAAHVVREDVPGAVVQRVGGRRVQLLVRGRGVQLRLLGVRLREAAKLGRVIGSVY